MNTTRTFLLLVAVLFSAISYAQTAVPKKQTANINTPIESAAPAELKETPKMTKSLAAKGKTTPSTIKEKVIVAPNSKRTNKEIHAPVHLLPASEMKKLKKKKYK